MTNQEQFKKDTEELYNQIKKYRRKYSQLENGGKFNRPTLKVAEDHLRTFLEIVWTDEESRAEYRRDGML